MEPSYRKRGFLPRGVLALCGLLALCGCNESQPPAATTTGPGAGAPVESTPAAPIPQGYVGSEACAACHSDQVHDYQHHPMSRSLARATEAAPIEDYENARFDSVAGLSYYVEKTDAGIVHHERRVDSDGEEIYDQGVPVVYAVGSGSRGRTYLINDDGRFYASPITWYSESGRWGLSPGYTPGYHQRFERRVTDGCIVCHAGRIAPHEGGLSRFDAERPFLEESIGCERCHGPGKEHVERHSATTPSDSADPIFNPAKVTDARRDAVCNQCHLQGHRRVVRSGRTEYDFRPGMALSDNWVVFLKTEGVEGGSAAAVSQVEQMYASQCYQKTQGGLSCIGCHSGHKPPTKDEAGPFFNHQCAACHSGGKPECTEMPERRTAANDSCIQCHMPKVAAIDVHAAQTDHRILRRPALAGSHSEGPVRMKDAKRIMFVEPGVRIPPVEQNRARGIFLAEQASAGGGEAQAREAVELLLGAMKSLPNDLESRYAVGLAFEKLQQPNLAAQAWEYILEAEPENEDALGALAALYHQSKDLSRAREYYERLVAVNPGKSRYHGRLAHVLGQMKDFRPAVQHAERALELNPSLVQTHQWLAEVFRSFGEKTRADKQEEIVRRFQSAVSTPSDEPSP